MKKITFVIFALLIVVSYSSFGYSEEKKQSDIMPLSKDGTISYGDRIYQHGEAMEEYVEYTYEGIENSSVKVKASSLWEGWEEIMYLPLDENNQAFLKAKNENKLVLTLIDKFGTIQVSEYTKNNQ